jgi:tetratricopeptide (TPR) repeat protein
VNEHLEKILDRLADQDQWQGIVTLIEQIPEEERDLDIVGWYVRALNNSWQLEKAVTASLRYRTLGKDDALWHYRLGYAYVNLSRYEEAEAALSRGKELAAKDQDKDVVEWIDELLEQMQEEKEDAAERAAAEVQRRAAWVPRDPVAPLFDGMDFTDFWDDCDYSLDKYVGAPATDATFAAAEQTLGYKLPESYKRLMRRHNGGVVNRRLFRVPFEAVDQPEAIYISGILGVDSAKDYALTGSVGSQFMIREWGYPDIGVAVCDTPSAGHEMIFLDYRNCGPMGEPEVVHVDQESDYAVTWLTGDFESFIRGLVCEDEDAVNYTAIVKHK